VGPDAEWDGLWCRHLLQHALSALARENPRQHETLRLRVEEEKAAREIAERLGRTEVQVKADLHRARERLARLLRAGSARSSTSGREPGG
jgi:RNA polymerase sigma factor (sigma-70 family)